MWTARELDAPVLIRTIRGNMEETKRFFDIHFKDPDPSLFRIKAE